MPDIESVNPQKTEIPDSEGSDKQWVDPIFTEEQLHDEPAPADAGEPEEGGDDKSGETAQQLDRVLAEDQGEGEAAEEAEAGAQKETTDAAAAKETPAADESAEAAAAADEDESGEEAEEDEGKPAGKPRRRSITRRHRRETQRQIDALNAQVQTLTQILAGNEEEGEAEGGDGEGDDAVSTEAPTLEEHDYDTDKWAKAFTEWTEQRMAAGEAKSQEEAANAELRKQHEIYGDALDTARDKYDDFDDVVYDTSIVIAPAAARIIQRSANGPEMAYWLATHQDEAKAMAQMSEVDAAVEYGRLEQKMLNEQAEEAPAGDAAAANGAADETATGETEQPAAEAEGAEEAQADSPSPKRRTVTQAPEPIPTRISGGAQPKRNPEKMSQDEYAKARRDGTIV